MLHVREERVCHLTQMSHYWSQIKTDIIIAIYCIHGHMRSTGHIIWPVLLMLFCIPHINMFNFSLHRCSCWGLKNVNVVITRSDCEIYEWYFLHNRHSAAVVWAAFVSIVYIALITHLEEDCRDVWMNAEGTSEWMPKGHLNEFELTSNAWADQRIHSLKQRKEAWIHEIITQNAQVKKVNLVAIKAALDNCSYMAMY